jgi:hypothetical protein
VNRFALEIWDDETEKVTFYTVKWEDASMSETDKFLTRMAQIPEMKEPLQRLSTLIIDVIGNSYGADEAFFNRFENKATALPPKGQIKISELKLDFDEFPLRLYCLAMTEELVILFNGGIKDARTAQQSSDSISMKFYEANEFTTRIFEALNSREIEIDGRKIVDYKGSSDIIL